jgi:hypothetical protein
MHSLELLKNSVQNTTIYCNLESVGSVPIEVEVGLSNNNESSI